MNKNDRFEVAYQEAGLTTERTIYVDKETGVHYLFIASGIGSGLTPLLGADGKPVVKKP